jgi:hypothetical protein
VAAVHALPEANPDADPQVKTVTVYRTVDRPAPSDSKPKPEPKPKPDDESDSEDSEPKPPKTTKPKPKPTKPATKPAPDPTEDTPASTKKPAPKPTTEKPAPKPTGDDVTVTKTGGKSTATGKSTKTAKSTRKPTARPSTTDYRMWKTVTRNGTLSSFVTGTRPHTVSTAVPTSSLRPFNNSLAANTSNITAPGMALDNVTAPLPVPPSEPLPSDNVQPPAPVSGARRSDVGLLAGAAGLLIAAAGAW